MTCDRCGIPAGLRWLADNDLWFDEEAGAWRWRSAIAFPDHTQARGWLSQTNLPKVELIRLQSLATCQQEEAGVMW